MIGDTPPANIGDKLSSSIVGRRRLLVRQLQVLRRSRTLTRDRRPPARGHADAEVERAGDRVVQRREPRAERPAVEVRRARRHARQQPPGAGHRRRRGDPGQRRRRPAAGSSDASVTWNTLIDAIKAAGGPTYQYRADRPGRRPGRRGSPAATSARASCSGPTAGCRSSTARAARRPTRPRWSRRARARSSRSAPAASTRTNPAFDDSRKPLAGEFTWKGKTLFVDRQPLQLQGRRRPAVRPLQPPRSASARSSGTRRRQIVNAFVARHPSAPTCSPTSSCSATSTTSSSPTRWTILEGLQLLRPVDTAAAERALLVRVRRQLAGARPHPGLAGAAVPAARVRLGARQRGVPPQAVRPRPAGRAAASQLKNSPPEPGVHACGPRGRDGVCSGARRRGARQRLRGGRLGGRRGLRAGEHPLHLGGGVGGLAVARLAVH